MTRATTTLAHGDREASNLDEWCEVHHTMIDADFARVIERTPEGPVLVLNATGEVVRPDPARSAVPP